MAFDLSTYAQKNNLQDKSLQEVAQHAFDSNNLGDRGYKDVGEWLNDPANAHNKAAVQQDAVQRPQLFDQYNQTKDLPSRGVTTDLGASIWRGVAQAPAAAGSLVSGSLDALRDYGIIDTDKDTRDSIRGWGQAITDTISHAKSKESVVDPWRGTWTKGVEGAAAGGTQMLVGAALGGGVGAALAPSMVNAASTYSETRKAALDSGKSIDDARNAATQNAAITGTLDFITNKLFMGLGGGKILSPAGEVANNVRSMFSGGFKQSMLDYAKASGLGYVTGLANVFSVAENSHRNGLSDVSGFDAVREEAGSVGVMTLIMSGMAPIFHGMERSGKLRAVVDGNVNPVARQSVMNEVYKVLNDSGNFDAADAWLKSSRDAIKYRRGLDVDNIKQLINTKERAVGSVDPGDVLSTPDTTVSPNHAGEVERVSGVVDPGDVLSGPEPFVSEGVSKGNAQEAPGIDPNSKDDLGLTPPPSDGKNGPGMSSDSSPLETPEPGAKTPENTGKGGDVNGLQEKAEEKAGEVAPQKTLESEPTAPTPPDEGAVGSDDKRPHHESQVDDLLKNGLNQDDVVDFRKRHLFEFFQNHKYFEESGMKSELESLQAKLDAYKEAKKNNDPNAVPLTPDESKRMNEITEWYGKNISAQRSEYYKSATSSNPDAMRVVDGIHYDGESPILSSSFDNSKTSDSTRGGVVNAVSSWLEANELMLVKSSDGKVRIKPLDKTVEGFDPDRPWEFFRSNARNAYDAGVIGDNGDVTNPGHPSGFVGGLPDGVRIPYSRREMLYHTFGERYSRKPVGSDKSSFGQAIDAGKANPANEPHSSSPTPDEAFDAGMSRSDVEAEKQLSAHSGETRSLSDVDGVVRDADGSHVEGFQQVDPNSETSSHSSLDDLEKSLTIKQYDPDKPNIDREDFVFQAGNKKHQNPIKRWADWKFGGDEKWNEVLRAKMEEHGFSPDKIDEFRSFMRQKGDEARGILANKLRDTHASIVFDKDSGKFYLRGSKYSPKPGESVVNERAIDSGAVYARVEKDGSVSVFLPEALQGKGMRPTGAKEASNSISASEHLDNIDSLHEAHDSRVSELENPIKRDEKGRFRSTTDEEKEELAHLKNNPVDEQGYVDSINSDRFSSVDDIKKQAQYDGSDFYSVAGLQDPDSKINNLGDEKTIDVEFDNREQRIPSQKVKSSVKRSLDERQNTFIDMIQTYGRHMLDDPNVRQRMLDLGLTEDDLSRRTYRSSDKTFSAEKQKMSFQLSDAKSLVDKAASELSGRGLGSVEVTTFDKLSPEDVAGMKRDGKLENGQAFTRDDGTIVVIADRHSSPTEVLSSYLHEAGHSGEQPFFGNKQIADKFFGDVASTFSGKVGDKLSALGLADTPENRLSAAREVFSDMLGDIESVDAHGFSFKHKGAMPFLNRAVAMMRHAIRMFGQKFGIDRLDLSFSENDIRYQVTRFLRGSETAGFKSFASKVVDAFHERVDTGKLYFNKVQSKYAYNDKSDYYGITGRLRSMTANFVREHIDPNTEAAAKSFTLSGITEKEFHTVLADMSEIDYGRHKSERAYESGQKLPEGSEPTAAQQAASNLKALKERIGPERYAHLEQAYQHLVDMHEAIIKRGEDTGYLSSSEAREMMDSKSYFSSSRTNNVGKTIDNAAQLLNKIDRNFALQHVYELAKQNPSMQEMRIVGEPSKGSLSADRTIPVSVAGETKYVEIRNDALLRVLKNTNDRDLGPILSGLRSLNTIRIKADLALNPAFWVKNLGRDAVFGVMNMMSRDKIGSFTGGQMSARVLKDIPAAMSALWAHHFSGQSTDWSSHIDLLNKGGVNMGMPFIGNPDRIQKTFKSFAKMHEDNLSGKLRTFNSKTVGKWIDGMAYITENSVRLAVLKNCLDSGLSEHQALNFAKEVSINFDRGGSMTPALNALYLYSNAKIRGITQTYDIMKQNPARFANVAAGIACIGFASSVMNRAVSGDDYDRIPAHIRSDNLIMMLPGMASGHLKMALPGELMPLINVGQYFADLVFGKNASGALTSLVSNTLSALNPIGGLTMGLDSGKSIGKGVLQAATPSFFRPIMEAMLGTKWYGGPLKNGDAGSYVATSIAGGVGKFIRDGIKTVMGNTDGVNNIPVVNAVAGNSPEYMNGRTTQFNDAISPYLALHAQLKELKGTSARQEFLKSLSPSDREMMNIAVSTNNRLLELSNASKRHKSSGNNSSSDVVSKTSEFVQNRFLEIYKKKAR